MKFSPSFGYPTEARILAFRITAIYAIAGGVWILFSDELLALFVTDPAASVRLQTLKGWLFIALTAILLFRLLTRSLHEVVRASRAAGVSEDRFQLLFHGVPVSLWELDLSAVKDEIDSLKMIEKRNLATYLAEQPAYVAQLLAMVRVLAVNETTLALFGARQTDELLGALDRLVAPDAMPVFRSALVALAGEPGEFREEFFALTLGGECKTLLATVSIPAEREKFDAVPVCLMDITERKQTDERLRLLESAIEQTSEAVTITTADLALPGPRIVFVNQAFTRMTGYEAEEVLGETPRILQGPKTEREVLDRMKRELFQRQSFRGETVNYRKDGREFVMEWFVTPIVNRDFQVTHFVAIQRDVTERWREEERLRQRLAELETEG
ncbi:PAS domain-containing protein [Geobacter pickeringii]|uniref:PAS domain-containing protein n=1 Tax=Geobacter pickeringii TaxID=345632 RepID=UPI00068D0F91|nr:PAS domain S-box protein [Geobacter pickeringii]